MTVDLVALKEHARKARCCCSANVIALADGLVDAIDGRKAAQKIISFLVKHLDEMAHVTHRAYHGGDPGYFHCSMPYCNKTAHIIRELENY